MAQKSNIKKASEIVELAEAWAAEREVVGDQERFVRSGVLNKSLVAETLGFSRSLWRSNDGLRKLGAQLDQAWGDARAQKSDLISRLDAIVAEADVDGEALPNDGKALLLHEILVLAGLEPRHLQRHSELRARLEAHAQAHDLVFSRRGYVASDEDAGPEVQDPAEMIPAARLREAQLRLAQAERRNAELKAENARLRAQIMRADEVAELIALGGRIRPDAR